MSTEASDLQVHVVTPLTGEHDSVAKAAVEESLAAAQSLLVDVPTRASVPVGDAVDFPVPAPLTSHGPARIVAVANQKGGVGKTTTSINLSAALAEYGRRVLLVDFDPQGALSVGLGINPLGLDRTVLDLLLGQARLDDVLLKTSIPGLDLLPSNIDLSGAELALANEVAREQTLARVLADAVPDYDFIIIDCQPSLGLLTVNALTAADSVLIPLQCEYFALRGVGLLSDIIAKVRDRLNPRLQIEGIVGTMHDPRTTHSREVLERIESAFGEKVFRTTIGRTVKFPDASVAGQPITAFAASSTGAQAYRQLAREVLSR